MTTLPPLGRVDADYADSGGDATTGGNVAVAVGSTATGVSCCRVFGGTPPQPTSPSNRAAATPDESLLCTIPIPRPIPQWPRGRSSSYPKEGELSGWLPSPSRSPSTDTKAWSRPARPL